jgi:4-hydroxy-2-oxoheptanedioate aldolase
LQPNKTKAKLKSGETVFGCFTRYPDATLVEVLGYQGWDFIVFDGEHGTIEPADCENMVRAAEVRGVTPIIRVPMNVPAVILRFMDTGAQGLHIPMINSKVDAEAAVRSVKYLPRGNRGLAAVRAAGFALAGPLGQYVVESNAETLVVIHIETIDAVEQLPELITVDGVDVIFVGPNDLSHSLGVPGEVQNPKVQAAIERIAETVAGSKLALGIMVANADLARQWRDRGARYITIGSDSLLSPACRNYLKAVRG